MNDTLLLVMTNGRREYISKTIPSALAMLQPGFVHRIICDDSGDEEYQLFLASRFPTFEIWTTEGNEGFGGAIRSIWASLRLRTGFNYVFHLEDDFTFNEPINIHNMIAVMDRNPHLQQMSLLRQPWYGAEIPAGGIMQVNPDDFVEHQYGPMKWVEHRKYFTTNPCIYRKSLIMEKEWPTGVESEGMFTHSLLVDPDVRFGIWGTKFGTPKVNHIGHERTGTGY